MMWIDYKMCLVVVWCGVVGCMVEGEGSSVNKDKLLISKWFPITEVSVESVRERSTSQVPGITSLHVWFARRPLTTSRAAILCTLLPSTSDQQRVLKILGIPENVDLREAQDKILHAKATGLKLSKNPFWWDRAFKCTPTREDLDWFRNELEKFRPFEEYVIVDPMAGGGSIPFEAMRLGLPVVAGDLNPVAFICLKGALEYTTKFGKKLLSDVESFCKEVHKEAKAELEEFFPKLAGEKVYTYLWGRSVKCSSCGLIVPLSPNWWIVKAKKDEESIAVKVVAPEVGDRCSFEIVKGPISHGLNPDKGTAKGGQAECPRCHTVMSSEEVKEVAKNGRMGHQLYCVCTKNKGVRKKRAEWNFRAPTDEEYEAIQNAEKRLKEKLPIWKAQNIVPNENFPETANERGQYSMECLDGVICLILVSCLLISLTLKSFCKSRKFCSPVKNVVVRSGILQQQ